MESGTRPDHVRAAQTEVERSRAVLKASEALLDDLKISSPIAGVVLKTNYEQGEFVQAGAALGTVADLSRMWVRVSSPPMTCRASR